MNRRAAVVLVGVFGGFFVLFLIFLGLAFSALKGQDKRSRGGGTGPKIGVVELKGTIGDDRNGIEGLREAEQIREFAEDDDIKALVIRIDSPGGAVAPSQEIWSEIKRTREKKNKKVVCSQGQLAASGGYYISVACDEIVANAGTLTGSIGVISQFFSASELVSLAKLQQTTLKTGPLKDSGSPFRPFNEEDRKYFEGLLGDIYNQFVTAVAEGRKKSVEEIKPLADGRVFSGLEAKNLGLVDTIGNFRVAVDRAMALANLTGEPDLIYPAKEPRFPFLDALKGGARSVGQGVAEGAAEGITGRMGLKSGVLLLAPGLTEPLK